MVYDPPHERSPITTQILIDRLWGIDLDPRLGPRSLRSGPEAPLPPQGVHERVTHRSRDAHTTFLLNDQSAYRFTLYTR